jgi:alanine racemase
MAFPEQPRPPSETLASGRLTIDLEALVANWRRMAAFAPRSACAAVVKADAYGIGIEPAVRALAAAGCETFFVAALGEGLRVRSVAPDAAVYVLDGLIRGSEAIYLAGDLRPVLNTMAEAEAWAALRPVGPKPPVAIQVDTGMNRLGLSLPEAIALAARADLIEALAPALLMSHLACADDPNNRKNREQLAVFETVTDFFPNLPASLANSGGVLLGPEFHFNLVRPGIALYGGRASVAHPALAPVVTMEARILQVRDVDAGQSVGYGAVEKLAQRTRIATLGVGYADGYHRLAGSSDQRQGGFAHIGETYLPIVGRVSMDLITVDVSEAPGAAVGDWVELIGHHIPLDDVAAHAGTIGYEILTSLGGRLARRYIGSR